MFFGGNVIIIAVVIIAAVLLIAKGTRKGKKEDNLKSEASVGLKWSKTIRQQIPIVLDENGSQTFSINTHEEYFVEFLLISGEKIQFKVNKNEYDNLKRDEKGILIYNDNSFCGFEKN